MLPRWPVFSRRLVQALLTCALSALHSELFFTTAQDAFFPPTGDGSPPTLVATLEQFRAALSEGAAHIIIMEHLDMTDAAPFGAGDAEADADPQLFRPRPETRSIRVRSIQLW